MSQDKLTCQISRKSQKIDIRQYVMRLTNLRFTYLIYLLRRLWLSGIIDGTLKYPIMHAVHKMGSRLAGTPSCTISSAGKPNGYQTRHVNVHVHVNVLTPSISLLFNSDLQDYEVNHFACFFFSEMTPTRSRSVD